MFSLVQGSHAVQVSLIISLGYKLIENVLVNPGHRGKIETGSFPVCLQQMLRQHHESHTDSRGYGLGKCSHVNHTAAPVHSLQRGNRLSLVSELAVIIILYQIPVCTAVSPGQQLLPPLHRHDNPCGILM